MEKAFGNAAVAMFAAMSDIKKIKARVTKEIKVKADNKESLLYEFLEELLFLLDTECFFLKKVEKIKIKDLELTATVVGDNKLKDYDIHCYAKAVTYNEMFVRKGKEEFTVQVVCDL